MNYVEFYKENIGNVPKNWEVHHIDHDHYNNTIINLVAIPKWLHRGYHNYFNQIKYYDPQRMISYKKDFLRTLNKFEEKYLLILQYANEKYDE